MSLTIETEVPPLHQDSSGAFRVGKSRVLLELVIRAFEDGATPEAIVQRYSTTTLAEVYAAIAYYLRHRADIEEYMGKREQCAAGIRQKIQGNQGDLKDLRRRLLSQRPAEG